jgi:hypothetical protein
MTARVKYQFTERRSNFVAGNLGANANDVLFLQRFVARYDVSNLDQDLVKLALDFAPSPTVDFGIELNLKKNRYKDTVLGRTRDDRQELYLTAAFGDRDVFRVLAFADYEVIKYDSVHRTINAAACPPASPNCFDPFQPATTVAFNWSARNTDKNSSFGLGFDWPVRERLMVKGSVLWGRSEGDVAVTAQALPTGAPAATLVPITNYGNNEKWAFNPQGHLPPEPELGADRRLLVRRAEVQRRAIQRLHLCRSDRTAQRDHELPVGLVREPELPGEHRVRDRQIQVLKKLFEATWAAPLARPFFGCARHGRGRPAASGRAAGAVADSDLWGRQRSLTLRARPIPREAREAPLALRERGGGEGGFRIGGAKERCSKRSISNAYAVNGCCSGICRSASTPAPACTSPAKTAPARRACCASCAGC